MGLNLSTNLPMFVYTFQAMWRHRPLEEYLVFVGIRAAYASFSPFTLVSTTWLDVAGYGGGEGGGGCRALLWGRLLGKLVSAEDSL